MTSILRASRRALLAAGVLACLPMGAAPAHALPGIGVDDLPDDIDIDSIQAFLADVASTVDPFYEATACRYVGGSVLFAPPGLSDSGLMACKDPWCHEEAVVSTMCFDRERLTNPDPRWSGLCVVYQNVAPDPIVIPDQSAVSPLETQCFDPLMHNSVYGGFCRSAAQVFCAEAEGGFYCDVYLSASGCVGLSSGTCTQEVQAFCAGYWHPSDGTPPVPATCILWVASATMCMTIENMEDTEPTDP